MPSLRITAIAALATAALVVPATASAQNGAVTGVIGTPTQVQVNLPAESEWTSCATEGARCEFTGTRQVRYGANGKFTLPRTFTGGVACNNAVFGDPAYGVVKQCQVTGGSQPKDEAATAAAISTQQSDPAQQLAAPTLQQAGSSAPACDPTEAQQAELNEMAQQIAMSQEGISDAERQIGEVQQIANDVALNEAERRAAMKAAADKAAQEAAQSQGNMSTLEQGFADFFNGLFGF